MKDNKHFRLRPWKDTKKMINNPQDIIAEKNYIKGIAYMYYCVHIRPLISESIVNKRSQVDVVYSVRDFNDVVTKQINPRENPLLNSINFLNTLYTNIEHLSKSMLSAKSSDNYEDYALKVILDANDKDGLFMLINDYLRLTISNVGDKDKRVIGCAILTLKDMLQLSPSTIDSRKVDNIIEKEYSNILYNKFSAEDYVIEYLDNLKKNRLDIPTM